MEQEDYWAVALQEVAAVLLAGGVDSFKKLSPDEKRTFVPEAGELWCCSH